MSKQKVLLIDGSNLLFRSHFAFARSGLVTKDGKPSGAVFGFIRLLVDAIDKEQPHEVFVAWDPKGGSFRDKKFDYYKANRPDEMPEDLQEQLPEVYNFLDYMGIKQKWIKNIEADDIMGTLAIKAVEKGWDALVYSGDRDLFQLVQKGIKVLYPSRKGGLELYGEKEVLAKMGVKPTQIIDYKGLSGDSSDNIKGVPGVGDKTAQKLLNQFNTFDGIFEHVDEVTPAGLQQKLKDNEQLARDSYWLATVKLDVDIDLDFEKPKPFKIQKDKLDEFIENYSLKSVKKILPDLLEKYGQTITFESAQAAEIKESLEISKIDFKKIPFKELNEVGVSVDSQGAIFVGYKYENKYFYSKTDDYSQLTKLDLQVLVYDTKTLIKKGTKFNNVIDIMLGLYVWNSSVKNDLDFVLEDIGYSDHGEEYGGLKLIWVKDFLVKELNSQRLDLWFRLENEVAKILADIELSGVYIDKDKLQILNDTLLEKQKEFTQTIYEKLGREDFNINSTQQLSVVLTKAGYKLGKKNKNGYFSTSSTVLEKFVDGDESGLIRDILDYRTVSKLHSSFTTAFLESLDKNSRLHTEYGQHVVPTGRLSSKNPNLQNIPIKHEYYGPLIRSCFAAAPGSTLMSADYSQIELRCLAHMSGDKTLIDAFKKGQDIHARTASEVFGVTLKKVDSSMRRLGKTLNFALVYQQGVFATSRQLNISTSEAKEFIEKYFGKFSKVQPLIENTQQFALENGYTETIWKRRRYFNNLKSGNAILRSAEERAAFNHILQGSGADIVKFAMIRLQRRIEEEKLHIKMVMQVHDELVFEVREKDADYVKKMIVEEMELGQPLSVPLKVDIGVGDNWNETK